MNEYYNKPTTVFSDLQQGYELIKDINEQIDEQYGKIEMEKEKLRQLQIDRNAYFTEFQILCEHYSNEMTRVNTTEKANEAELDKLRRKLTGEDDDSDRMDLNQFTYRRFPEAL